MATMVYGEESTATSDALARVVVGIRRSVSHCELVPHMKEIFSRLKSTHSQSFGTIHPLGFLVIRLQPTLDANLIRIHIWPEGERTSRQPCWMVHDHAWDFKSHILCGSVSNDSYSVTTDAESPSGRLYGVRYDADSSTLHRTERQVSYQLDRTDLYQRGEYYEVRMGQYHSTRVPEGTLACTVVLTTNPSQATAKVVGSLDGETLYGCARNRCPPLLFRDLVNSVDQRLTP
jgi:hypothetical protein